MNHHLLWMLLLSSCGLRSPEVANMETPPLTTAASQGIQHEGLARLLQNHWEATLVASPVMATELGDHRFDSRLGDPSLDSHGAWMEKERGWLEEARSLEGLSGTDVTTHRLFIEELEVSLALETCSMHQWSFSPRSNFLGFANYLVELHPLTSVDDSAALFARTRAMPGWLAARLNTLREGLKRGLVTNAASTQKVMDMVQTQLEQPQSDWPALQFECPKDNCLDDSQKAQLVDQYNTLREEVLVGALKTYLAFLTEEVLPQARGPQSAGLVSLPGGGECYQALIQRYTTRPLTADQIHQAGLDALTGIHAEFLTLGKALWDTEVLAEVFERLRTDPDLFFTSEDEVEQRAIDALAAARAKMPDFFDPAPKADCIVERVPDYEAPYTTIAYYRPGAPGGERPGTYFINTYAPETRPRHEAEVLAFHESIPGHHLQFAVAQELPEMPMFRRHLNQTVFVEGWALYTERLAAEMGLYSGDVDRLGMLSFDAWRASRLVVDTGIHAKGWTREEAEAFMAENTPLAPNNIHNEVDRYITWPGQALAYKTGQMEIWRMRREAEATLGESFDIRGFHNAVLSGGPVSLSVLEQQVDAWVEAVQD